MCVCVCVCVRALAKNCNVAKLDSVKGAEAKDWRAGKPVRVVRNCKGRKHSTYAPDEGNRYDGLYKVQQPAVVVNSC